MFPEQLAELIATAIKAPKSGKLFDCRWTIMPTITEVDEIAEDRQIVTNVLGQTIFDEKNPHYARLALDCYKELEYKLNSFSSEKVVLMLAGANASAIHISAMNSPYKDLFPYSDLDIKIMINPHLSRHEYNNLRSRITAVVNQVFATHKRRLDRLFFKRRENDNESNYFFDDATKDEFKNTFAQNLNNKSNNIKPCFTDDFVRNRCSTNSYMILNSIAEHAEQKSSVMVEVPHLQFAERIPLPYTPIFVSVNNTINVTDPDNGGEAENRTVSFTLYRVRMKHVVELADSETVKVNIRVQQNRVSLQIFTPYEKVSADFVDLSIPNLNDTELLDFTRRGGFEKKLTTSVKAFGFNLTLPTINECKLEYYKMLYVFNCPDSKREKRELKYAALNAATAKISPIVKTVYAAKLKSDLKKEAGPKKIRTLPVNQQLVVV